MYITTTYQTCVLLYFNMHLYNFKVYILKSCIHLDFIKYGNIIVKWYVKTTNKNQNLVRAFSDVLVTFIYFDIYH